MMRFLKREVLIPNGGIFAELVENVNEAKSSGVGN